MCGCPVGHLLHCHTALIRLCGMSIIGPRCMFPLTCHCSCSSGLNMLIPEANKLCHPLALVCLLLTDIAAAVIAMHGPAHWPRLYESKTRRNDCVAKGCGHCHLGHCRAHIQLPRCYDCSLLKARLTSSVHNHLRGNRKRSITDSKKDCLIVRPKALPLSDGCQNPKPTVAKGYGRCHLGNCRAH